MGKVVKILVGVMAAFVAAGVVGVILEDKSAPERIEKYLDGTDVREYAAAHFRVTFPGAPEQSIETADAGGTSIPVSVYSRDLGDSRGFAVSFFDLPADVEFSLDNAVNATAAAIDGTVQSSTALQVQDFDAVEFVASVDGRFFKAVIIRAPSRVYQVQVLGKENPPLGYDKFKESFRIEP